MREHEALSLLFPRFFSGVVEILVYDECNVARRDVGSVLYSALGFCVCFPLA